MSEFAVMPLADYVNSCDKIREKTDTTDNIKSGEMPEKINEVYEQGYNNGKQAEYDAFWDTYQSNGVRKDYTNAFSGAGWMKDLFRPKYDIIASNFYQAFYNNVNIFDLKQHLQDCGVTLDTSRAKTLNYSFQYAGMTALPVINATSAKNIVAAFSYMPNLTHIEKLVLKSDGSQSITDVFNNDDKLIHLIVEGTIGKNGFDVSWSPLNKASLTSIVNALSATTTSLTVTLRLDAVKKAFETSEGAMDGLTSDEWLNLIATKSNWTISLI